MGVSEGRGEGAGVGITFHHDSASLVWCDIKPEEVVTSPVDVESGCTRKASCYYWSQLILISNQLVKLNRIAVEATDSDSIRRVDVDFIASVGF